MHARPEEHFLKKQAKYRKHWESTPQNLLQSTPLNNLQNITSHTIFQPDDQHKQLHSKTMSRTTKLTLSKANKQFAFFAST
jgi:hypothetical protein